MKWIYISVVLACAVSAATGCGGSPDGPDRVTEAQVSSNGAWRGTFGERGTVSGSGGVGGPFIIGQGQQCATTQIVTGTITTVRVGRSDAITLHAPSNSSGTVCGEGLIGSGR